MGKKIAVGMGILVIVGLAGPWILENVTLEALKERQAQFSAYQEDNSALVLALFFIGYVLVTSLSLPGAAIMTLAAGALFGVFLGTLLVSFASSIGATMAFLVARFILGESLQKKYADKLTSFNKGFEREGAFYLFALRLVPAMPFFLLNILMGLTKIRTVTFYWVSQLGMLAGTIVFVNAGTQLAKIDSLGGILSPGLIGSFVALALVPVIAKKALEYYRKSKGGETEAQSEPKSKE